MGRGHPRCFTITEVIVPVRVRQILEGNIPIDLER